MDCAVGFFQPLVKQTACIMCPTGTTTNTEKSASCQGWHWTIECSAYKVLLMQLVLVGGMECSARIHVGDVSVDRATRGPANVSAIAVGKVLLVMKVCPTSKSVGFDLVYA